MPRLATLAFVSACFLLSTAAQAEYYGNPSLPPHPYAAQKIQPYATRVAPRMHVNHHGTEQQRNYIYVGSHRITAPASGRFDRRYKPVDHGLTNELRQRRSRAERAGNERSAQKTSGRGIFSTAKIVRHRPMERASREVVDDTGNPVTLEQTPRRDGRKRVIAADAEVTIFGPDRISIRLFRKGQGPRATARSY
jgi:hypothetical protein